MYIFICKVFVFSLFLFFTYMLNKRNNRVIFHSIPVYQQKLALYKINQQHIKFIKIIYVTFRFMLSTIYLKAHNIVCYIFKRLPQIIEHYLALVEGMSNTQSHLRHSA